MNEIIDMCGTLPVVFKVILMKKLLGSIILKLRNICVRWGKKEYVFYKTFVIYLSEVLCIGEVSK